ncbi:hypothetical protein [Hamadaea tsunoensis]|uniref:hypothetical protein n=1 Tax=Hamadaea tsunoensis TaxID=53368 RepID=UPI000413C2FC|nr:hypothetical protein [Hamadaea tsunoensis]
MDRLPPWLRDVLTIEQARRWRVLAATPDETGERPIVAGRSALVALLRHRVCDELTFAAEGDPLLREPSTVCGLPVESLDDAVARVLAALPYATAAELPPLFGDLAAVERLTPLRVEEGLILLGLAYDHVDPAAVVDTFARAGDDYWLRRLPELRASLVNRGYVHRTPGGPPGARALTIGTDGQVWVPPHQRDGHEVGGYWRRR